MTLKKRLIAIMCAATLAAFGLAGCAGSAQQGATNDAQSQNRQFMSQVNETVEDMGDRLQDFDDAVSRSDVVTMRSAADEAFACISTLESLEAPEQLTDIKQQYVDACNTLSGALGSYVDLYAEIESATDEAPFDYSTYESRLAEIQSAYNEGIEQLKAADTAATEA